MFPQGGSGPCDSATFTSPFSDPTAAFPSCTTTTNTPKHSTHHRTKTTTHTQYPPYTPPPATPYYDPPTFADAPTIRSASIENLKSFDPFAEADEGEGGDKQSQNYIHIRIQQRNGRKTLTTVQGLPKKFDQKKILKVIKKKFACNGTIVHDSEMGEVIQLQGDQRKDVQEFLIDKKEGLELDAKTIKVHGF
ncbi:Eukaryotic translation initiation factor eIF-1 [Friedmanniomyces endolithicus]|nr:Eukaryotic translation initiation factor eIF-1 [Friedmanniomyces endolithicus]